MKAPTALAGVYKCTDNDGQVTYQSRPCASDNTQSKIKLKSRQVYHNSGIDTPSANSQQSATTKVPTIVLYSTAWCGYCEKVRQLFADNAIAFKEFDIEKSAKAKRQYDKLNGKGVPLTSIDGRVVRGYNAKMLLTLAKPI